MRYRLINKSNIPSDDIHSVILFTAPRGIDNFTITVRNATDDVLWNAYAFPSRTRGGSATFYFKTDDILFPVASNSKKAKEGGYFPICILKDKYELLIHLFAHELRHIWQGQVSKSDTWLSKRGSYKNSDGEEVITNYMMERDSCQYAKKMLQKYRKML